MFQNPAIAVHGSEAHLLGSVTAFNLNEKRDEDKFKALQDLSENLEEKTQGPQYALFLKSTMIPFLQYLSSSDIQFISENYTQKCRKLVLDIISRLPINEYLQLYIKQIVSIVFKLLQIENEENSLLCCKIIKQLIKSLWPYCLEEIVKDFMNLSKMRFAQLCQQVNQMFKPHKPIAVDDLMLLDIKSVILDTFTITSINVRDKGEKRENEDKGGRKDKDKSGYVSYNLLPCAGLSLKVLAKLNSLVYLICQAYNETVHQDILDIIPLIMRMISLKPSEEHRMDENFNRKVYVEFLTAQVKALKLVAKIASKETVSETPKGPVKIRIFQNAVKAYSNTLAGSVISLFETCPPEAVHLRRKLLVIANQIFGTSLWENFIPFIDKFLDERILIGSGWTVNEIERPYAYSVLAGLLLKMSKHLSLSSLKKAVMLFSKNIHDDKLAVSVQTKSCVLVTKLVMCVRIKSTVEKENGKVLLMQIADVFAHKLKTIVKDFLPVLSKKSGSNQQKSGMSKSSLPSNQALVTKSPLTSSMLDSDQENWMENLDSIKEANKPEIGFPSTQVVNCSVSECRCLVRTLVNGVTAVINEVYRWIHDDKVGQTIDFSVEEIVILIRFAKYTMHSVDIYSSTYDDCGQTDTDGTEKTSIKEEKEVLELLSGIFSKMDTSTFRGMCSSLIEFIMERMYQNSAIQIFAECLIADERTSNIFVVVLMEFLLKHMDRLGSSPENADFHLKLFKIVFQSISLHRHQNEMMLKGQLQRIVKDCLNLVLRAKEPVAYIQLLQHLFSAIAGKDNEIFQQELLPVLPDLLQDLRHHLNAPQKDRMKTALIEIFLKIPLDLPLLLPYVPLFMDPIVCGLTASQDLKMLSLKTLEHLIDNVQLELLVNYVEPVGTQLMQELWRCIRNPEKELAHLGFRIVGKLGGVNRQFLIEPQKLQCDMDYDKAISIQLKFDDTGASVPLPIEKAIGSAFDGIRSPADSSHMKHCWDIIKGYLAASMQHDPDERVKKFFMHKGFATSHMNPVCLPLYTYPVEKSRNTHEMALMAMIVAASDRVFGHSVEPFMTALINHYATIMVAQECGIYAGGGQVLQCKGMDPLVLIDAVISVMALASDDRQYYRVGCRILTQIVNSASSYLASDSAVVQFPFCQYMAEKVCSLCYERPWYAKLGGCLAVRTLIGCFTPKWVFMNMRMFTRALISVILNLSAEISSITCDTAREILIGMITRFGAPLVNSEDNEHVVKIQKSCMSDIAQRLIGFLVSPSTGVREVVVKCLKEMSRVSMKPVVEIMSPHQSLLHSLIVPRTSLFNLPFDIQISLMSAQHFCMSQDPPLFTFDLDTAEQKTFFEDLLRVSQTEDEVLRQFKCFKDILDFVELRKHCLLVLSVCRFTENREKDVLAAFFKALSSQNYELQEIAFESLKKLSATLTLDPKMVDMDSLWENVANYEAPDRFALKLMSYVAQLFPAEFSQNVSEKPLNVLVPHLTNCYNPTESTALKLCEDYISIFCTVIEIFHQIPALMNGLVDLLLSITLETEKKLKIESGSPFREAYIKFLLKSDCTPEWIVDALLSNYCKNRMHKNQIFEHVLKGDHGKAFRDVFQQKPKFLLTNLLKLSQSQSFFCLPHGVYAPIRVLGILVKYDSEWLSTQSDLVNLLHDLWTSKEFQEFHRMSNNIDYFSSKVPKIIVKCLLSVFQHHTDNFELLFSLMRAFTGRFLVNFDFLRDFLRDTVVKYPVEWIRNASIKFIRVFLDDSYPTELKAKIVHYILIPSFQSAFDRGEGDLLVKGALLDQEGSNNLVVMFLDEVLDADCSSGRSDSVRIALLQLSYLLVERAPEHILTPNKQGKINRKNLMAFALPCLLGKNCIDPSAKYLGHLLLANIIAKFSRFNALLILQVFNSLLTAHDAEAQNVICQALDILVPVIPTTRANNNGSFFYLTKTILVDEGHNTSQLLHVLKLILRHYKVYFPVRHDFIHHMVAHMQKLMSFTCSASQEQCAKVAIDIAETIIRWEVENKEGCKTKEAESKEASSLQGPSGPCEGAAVAAVASTSDGIEQEKVKSSLDDSSKPVDQVYADIIVNFLVHTACLTNQNPSLSVLSRRCVRLLKIALRPGIWSAALLRLEWIKDLLLSVNNPHAVIGNVCTALEILSFLLTIMNKDLILKKFQLPIQEGILTCAQFQTSKVVSHVHLLLSRLTSIIPVESSLPRLTSHHEFQSLYLEIDKLVSTGLLNFVSNSDSQVHSVAAIVSTLKAVCTNSPCYVDRHLESLVLALSKITERHLLTGDDSLRDAITSGLTMVQKRVGMMTGGTRSVFMEKVLTRLIKESSDVQLLKFIMNMVTDWLNCDLPAAINYSPSLTDQSALILSMSSFEKRHPAEIDLIVQYLELVLFIFRKEKFLGTDLVAKLEPAFMTGLRFVQPDVRRKFFAVFDLSIGKAVYDRLMYIVCSQNWETAGPHFWIIHCVELLLACSGDGAVGNLMPNVSLPPVTSTVGDLSELENVQMDLDKSAEEKYGKHDSRSTRKKKMLQHLAKHLESMKKIRESKSSKFLEAMAQLCHRNASLAEYMWVELFPSLWKLLSENQRKTLGAEIVPFLCSTSNISQMNCTPDSIAVFVDAVARCVPPIQIEPPILKYLGKAHKLWYRSCLLNEQLIFGNAPGQLFLPKIKIIQLSTEETVESPRYQHEALDVMSEMYSLLNEDDLWCALWQERAVFSETASATRLEQLGFFERARSVYHIAMAKYLEEGRPASVLCMDSEHAVWTEHWMKCSKELNEWEELVQVCSTEDNYKPFIVADNVWRSSNWELMKEALTQVEKSCPKELSWKINMYKAYLCIYHPQDYNLSNVRHLVEAATDLSIKEWRSLPIIISDIHIPILQSAQQIVELEEALKLHFAVQAANRERGKISLCNEVGILKSWRDRDASISDNLSHWAEIFSWRQENCHTIISTLNKRSGTLTEEAGMLLKLATEVVSQASIKYATVARRHGLPEIALRTLSKMKSSRELSADANFQKVRQSLKCYHQIAVNSKKIEASMSTLMEGLELLSSAELKYFNKSMKSELFAMKGMFLALLGHSTDANAAFRSATDQDENVVRVWQIWGDYICQCFAKSAPKKKNMELGALGLICILRACSHHSSENHLSKVFWLLSYDDENHSLARTVVEKISCVPVSRWLQWIPQLITCLSRSEGAHILSILQDVGRSYPQAIIFHLQTLRSVIRMESRGKEIAEPSKLSVAMERCDKIVQAMRDYNPAVVSALEIVGDQLKMLRENIYEEILHELRYCITECYIFAFEKGGGVVFELSLNPQMFMSIKWLMLTFGIATDPSVANTRCDDYVIRRLNEANCDSCFQEMKRQFIYDFGLNKPYVMKLHVIIKKLKKWVKYLELKMRLLPKSFLLEEKALLLSRFCGGAAKIEIPCSFLSPKANEQYVYISRFMPKVNIKQKYESSTRQIIIKGHNGKEYPYLVVSSRNPTDGRSKERVMQLLRLFNQPFLRYKETCRRGLQFDVPKVVVLGPRVYLVQDDSSSLSLLDIYKQCCEHESLEFDAPWSHFCGMLPVVGPHGALKAVRQNMVPCYLLTDWVKWRYPSAADYWMFRKKFTTHLAITNLAEFVLHLTSLKPEMLYVNLDSGSLNVAFHQFYIKLDSGTLRGNAVVPFRLTPNISEFITAAGIQGPMTASMIAAARCLAQSNFQVLFMLRAILRDEMIEWHKTHEGGSTKAGLIKEMDGAVLTEKTDKAVTAITMRLQALSKFTGANSEVKSLLNTAYVDEPSGHFWGRCRMDPTWLPWF